METNTATLLSGLISAFGGAIGAYGAYLAARHQTKKMIEHDRTTRIKERKIRKLEEINTSIAHAREQLSNIYKSILDQKQMIQIVVDNKYSVFQTQDFITHQIEDEFIKGLLLLQNLRVFVNSNRDSLPVRMDELEFLTACRRMEGVIKEFQDIKDLMVKKKTMTLQEFANYYHELLGIYEEAKRSIDTFVIGPVKIISEEIDNNL